MGIRLNDDLAALLRDDRTTKVLATVDADGTPHAVVKQSLAVDADGNLVHLELLESSRTNKNLLRALWFGGRVAVTVRCGDASWQIKGRPVRAHVAGPVFQREYARIRRARRRDLGAVWIIEPDEATTRQPSRNATRRRTPALRPPRPIQA
jgi:hypothetical protein